MDTLAPLATPRHWSVAAHLERSKYWSNHVDALGPTALIYGALELRMGIEAALVQLLMRVRGKNLNESDLKALRSARSIQARIHEIEGNQQKLDRKLEFLRILLSVAGAPHFPLAFLRVGKAYRHWQRLSELCHFNPALNLSAPGDAIKFLIEAEQFLEPIAQAMLVWPEYHDSVIQELETRFVRGELSDAAVRGAILKRGAWALITHADGSKQFASDVWG